MKRILLSIFCAMLFTCNLQAVQLSDFPGTPVWTLAEQNNIIVTTIESQVNTLGQDITDEFDGTFTALDDLLAKMCTVQSQAEQLATQVNTLEVNFGNDASKMCVIDSKVDALLIDVQAIDTQRTFTALEDMQQTLCSKIEQLNAELAQVETEIINITQTEIDHDQTILSKLNIIDTNGTTINSILDNITFDANLTSIDSLLDVIDMCLATIDSKLAPLESTIEVNFAGTFTALDANLQKACTIESLTDKIPMSFMADLTGVYTALKELEQTMCTIDSKVDNLDISVMTIESDTDILNSTIDQTLSKLCVLESKTDITSCSQCFSLMESIGTNLSNDCSILDALNNNELLEKACTIDSNLDIINAQLSTENSKLEVIASEADILESKICAAEMNNTTLSKLDIIDSKIDVAQETTLTIASLVDVIDQISQTIESTLCNLSDDNISSKLDVIISETETTCSNLEELINVEQTINSKLDQLLTASAGYLCPDFGTGGLVTTDIGILSLDTANAVTVQSDGKIIAAGEADIAAVGNIALARYNPDGSLDTSFDGDGIVTTVPPGLNLFSTARGVAIQSDNKIVIGGEVGLVLGVGTDILVARYNSDGSLDSSFGGTGIVTTSPPLLTTYNINAMILQPDGKVVVAGTTTTTLPPSINFLLARYNPDGSLDTGFGTGGIVTTDLGGIDVANALLLQPDGKIIAIGVSGTDFAVARYNTDGTLDTATFGSGSGFVTTTFGGIDVGNTGALQPNGKIIAAGSTDTLGPLDFAMAQYNTDGTLDTTFGSAGTGLVIQSFGGLADDTVNAIALQPNNRIILVGSTDILGGFSFAIARFLANGLLDAQFGTNGLIVTDFSAGISIDSAHAAIYTPDDRLIAAGETDSLGGFDFALACYELGINPIFFIPPKLEIISEKLEKTLDNGITISLNSKLDNIESLVCTIESNMDVAGSLVDNSITKAINLEDDYTSTWTILDVVENKLRTSKSFLENVHSKLDNASAIVDFSEAYTAIEALAQKACTVDSKVDAAILMVDDIDFSGVFTALDSLKSKVCFATDIISTITATFTSIDGYLGTPITQADVDTELLELMTPGRYYLAENITYNPAESHDAITIATSNVYLDLNGFTLEQNLANSNFVTAIGVSATSNNVTIRNGTLKGFRSFGISLAQNNNVIIESMKIGGRGDDLGIRMLNCSQITVQDCVLSNNHGINMFSINSDILIKDCLLLNTGTTAFAIQVQQTDRLCLQNTKISNPLGVGIDFAITTNNCTVDNCTIDGGTRQGIVLRGTGHLISNSIIVDNGSIFFPEAILLNGTTCDIINNNIASNFGFGISVTSGVNCYIANNTLIENNGTANISQTSPSGNTYLGNFAFKSSGTNYSIAGGSSLTGKFVTIAQNGAFPATEPTEWHNINMLQ